MASSAPDQLDSDKTSLTFEDFRKQDVISDFVIKVGDESILTHQQVLISHSEYFRAMLTHDTKEKQQGFVGMKNVSLDGIRECIEFMYTGETNMNDGTVERILQAADMMQLLKVKDKSLEYLDENLQSNNCISTLNLVLKYSCPDLQNKSQKMFDEYFDITLSELLEMSMEDLTEYYESHTFTNEIAWDGILNWIKYKSETRSGFVFKLVELLDWDKFPSGILLRKLWSELLVRNSQPCRKLLFEKLFLNLEIFEENLRVVNYFILEKLSREFEYVIKEIKLTLWLFLKRNIVRLSAQKEFMSLDSSKILSLFLEVKHEIFAPEKWWWNTAVLWVNKDPSRKKLFPRLMRSIRFDRLPKSFVDTVVRNEPMVTESRECVKILIDALYTKINEKETEASLVLLYSDGRMRSLELESGSKQWQNLTFEGIAGQSGQIFYFNGKLCLVGNAELFYLHNNNWIKKCSIPSDSDSRKFCILDEFIYIVSKSLIKSRFIFPASREGGLLYCYDSSKDTWDKTASPDNFLFMNSIAASDGCLYTFSNSKIREFEVAHQVWRDAPTTNTMTSLAVTVGKNIYTCGSNRSVNILDADKELKKWENLSVETQYDNSGKFIQQDTTSIKFAFDLRGSVVVMTEKSIYIYDNVCNKWRIIKDLPEYVTGTKERQSTVCVQSACITFNDVNYTPQPSKRQKLGTLTRTIYDFK